MQHLDDSIHHRHRKSEQHLPPQFERCRRWVGHHVEREHDERGAGHRHHRHNGRETVNVRTNLALQRETEQPRRDERQPTGETAMDDDTG